MRLSAEVHFACHPAANEFASTWKQHVDQNNSRRQASEFLTAVLCISHSFRAENEISRMIEVCFQIPIELQDLSRGPSDHDVDFASCRKHQRRGPSDMKHSL